MDYRLYFLDADAHINGVRPFECEGDEVAISIAERTAQYRPFELWNRDRLVIRQWVTSPSD
jgi:hypothetical protein